MLFNHKIPTSHSGFENQQFPENSKFFSEEKTFQEEKVKRTQLIDSQFPDFFAQLPIQRLGKTPLWKYQNWKIPTLDNETLEFRGHEETIEKKDEEINSIQEIESEQSEEDFKYGRKRKKDQNLCKKYHSVAQKIIKKLNLHHFLLYIKKIKHRLEYFLILTLIVQKMQKTQSFQKYYKKAAEKEIRKYEALKKKIMPKKDDEKNDHIILGFKNSIKSLQVFMKGNIQDALIELFDKTKAKSHIYESKSLKRIQKLNKQFRSSNKKIEEILDQLMKDKK